MVCILIVIVICGGCTQRNPVTGDYRNEANNTQYIVFGEMGTFSHYNYNNTRDLLRTGNFTVNDNITTLSYTNGQISKFYIEFDGNELIPIDENKSDAFDKKLEKRFAKRLEQ